VQDRVDTSAHVYRALTGWLGSRTDYQRARTLGGEHAGAAAALALFVHAMVEGATPAPGRGRSKSWQVAAQAATEQRLLRIWVQSAAFGRRAKGTGSTPVQPLPGSAKRGVKRVAPVPVCDVGAGPSQSAPVSAPVGELRHDASRPASSQAAKRACLAPEQDDGAGAGMPLPAHASTAAATDGSEDLQMCPAWHEATAAVLAAGACAAGAAAGNPWPRLAARLRSEMCAPRLAIQLGLACALARLDLQAREHGTGGDSARAPVDAAHPLASLAKLALLVPLPAFQGPPQRTRHSAAIALPPPSSMHLSLTLLPLAAPLQACAAASLQLLCLARRLGPVGAGRYSAPDWVQSVAEGQLGPLAHGHVAPRALFGRGAAGSASQDEAAACVSDVLGAFAAATTAACAACCGETGRVCVALGCAHGVLALACVACMHAAPLVALLLGRVDDQIAAAQMPPPAFTPSLLAPRSSERPALSTESSRPFAAPSMQSGCTPPALERTPSLQRPPPQPPPSSVRPSVRPDLLRAQTALTAAEAHIVAVIAHLAVRFHVCVVLSTRFTCIFW
jgi:hypothetical protein